MKRIFLLALIALTLRAQDYMRTDSTNYRNLALHRPAWHSSSYGHNLTAQLVTDGIKETALPRWVSTATSAQGVIPRFSRTTRVAEV
jgi:hypothetical protein